MQKILLILLLYLLPAGYITDTKGIPDKQIVPDYHVLYKSMELEGKVSYIAFEQALTGFLAIEERKKEILTLIDFSKPSTEERLFVLDMENRKILYSSHVSHGRNSGENYATSFSNEMGSYKSSLGFYLTDGTYQGKNGYSLLLNGLEKGINDRARERAVVIHGASYSDPSVIRYSGRLGRSQGCPALPLNLCKPIIDTIKGGTILFVFANDPIYQNKSSFLSSYFHVS